jgi:hypothetical protein
MDHIEEVNQSLTELLDAATALHDAVEKAKPMIEAIEARWGKDVWERHRRNEHQRAPLDCARSVPAKQPKRNGPRCAGQVQAFPREEWRG